MNYAEHGRPRYIWMLFIARIVSSILLYATAIWKRTIHISCNAHNLNAAHIVTLRGCNAFRTVLDEAIFSPPYFENFHPLKKKKKWKMFTKALVKEYCQHRTPLELLQNSKYKSCYHQYDSVLTTKLFGGIYDVDSQICRKRKVWSSLDWVFPKKKPSLLGSCENHWCLEGHKAQGYHTQRDSQETVARNWLPKIHIDNDKLVKSLHLQNPNIPIGDLVVIK